MPFFANLNQFSIPLVQTIFDRSIDEDKKDEEGSEAINENNFLNNIIKTIKQNFPEILVVADVALDPYTIHGHDGVLNSYGDVDNDRTLKILEDQALKLAHVGTDIIAPSDMMDGRIGVLRKALEEQEFKNTMILAYSAKYSSKFYGPFKEAVESAKFFEIKQKTLIKWLLQTLMKLFTRLP